MRDSKVGPGGAPTRATTIPEDAAARKEAPVASGVLDYFPDALVAIAQVSYAGNQQHNPGQPLHWNRAKSGDEDDALIRHFLQRGTVDSDGIRHSAKMAWRALALLQKELEAETAPAPARPALVGDTRMTAFEVVEERKRRARETIIDKIRSGEIEVIFPGLGDTMLGAPDAGPGIIPGERI